MKISYSKTFEKKFLKYNKKLQEKIFQAIQALPSGDVKRLTGNKIPPVYRAVFVKVVVRFIHAAFNKTSSSARISFGGFSHTSVIWLQSLISPDQRLGLRLFACL